MERFVVRGGRPLQGEVAVGGAKNSALKLLAATLVAPGTHVIESVPDIADMRVMLALLEGMGVSVSRSGTTITVTVPDNLEPVAPYELVKEMRASIVVLGPLLTRFNRARVAMPGGCNIGARKIDMHLAGLEKMGAVVAMERGDLEVTGSLRGARILLDWPSHGATENLLMAATLAKGTTQIENAARDPEIVDLCQFLRSMGARITGDGTPVLEVEGVDQLHGANHRTIGDRLEAGTYLIAAAATQGDVTIRDIDPMHLDLVLEKLSLSGSEIETTHNSVTLKQTHRPRAVDVVTLPYPGFPTDLQPQWMAMLATAEGTAIITENVFEGRFSYTGELARLGADIRTEGHHAIVRGVEALEAAPVDAPDIRGGAALVIAALTALGETEITGTRFIDRGYASLERSLSELGAEIHREPAA
jgi:UDP-N-acetylglucosamine 1-carboxyvinyltransferase